MSSVKNRLRKLPADGSLAFETRFAKICADLRALLEERYQSGSKSAAARILSAVTSGPSSALALNDSRSPAGRVPRGATRVFVESALVGKSLTIREIRETAKTESEAAISYQTIRLELERGKKAKRYKKHEGKWSLA